MVTHHDKIAKNMNNIAKIISPTTQYPKKKEQLSKKAGMKREVSIALSITELLQRVHLPFYKVPPIGAYLDIKHIYHKTEMNGLLKLVNST